MVNWFIAKAYALYQVLVPINFIILLIFIIILVPLAFFRRTRPSAAVGFYIGSYVLGFTLWLSCSIISLVMAGIGWLIAGILLAGIGVVPIALIALLWNGYWIPFIQQLIFLVVIFSFRALSFYLNAKDSPK